MGKDRRWTAEGKRRMQQRRAEGEGGPGWAAPTAWKRRADRLRVNAAGVVLRIAKR